MSNVRETWWADRDRDCYAKVAEWFPAALETSHDEWQSRVDGDGETEISPHSYLQVVKALRFERRNDVTAPTGEERVYLVTAESSGDAWRKVQAHLAKQGFKSSDWAMFLPADSNILVLS